MYPKNKYNIDKELSNTSKIYINILTFTTFISQATILNLFSSSFSLPLIFLFSISSLIPQFSAFSGQK